MSIKAVLFDLDGTLLPMDQDVFVKSYFGGLVKKLAPHGYDSKMLVDAIWSGTSAMVANDGTKTNDKVFWDTFCKFFGDGAMEDLPIFDDFYANDFDRVQEVCSFSPKSREIVELVKSLGLRPVLATNPLFPAVATRSRIRWAGLCHDDFELVTTYENSSFCKPSLDYYKQITSAIGVSPDECAMIGNDVDDDMVASELGMKVFLLTDCLINKKGRDTSVYPSGSFDELKVFIRSLVE